MLVILIHYVAMTGKQEDGIVARQLQAGAVAGQVQMTR